jgi:hypothetical protein
MIFPKDKGDLLRNVSEVSREDAKFKTSFQNIKAVM